LLGTDADHDAADILQPRIEFLDILFIAVT
jgi:hypothetical protein